MKKKKLNLIVFRAFVIGSEFHIVAENKEQAATLALKFLGKGAMVFPQMDTEFTRMLLSKRKVGVMNTTSISGKDVHHDTHLSEGRKLSFLEVKG